MPLRKQKRDARRISFGRPFSPLPPPHIDIFCHICYSIHHSYPSLQTMRSIIMLNIQHLTKVYVKEGVVFSAFR